MKLQILQFIDKFYFLFKGIFPLNFYRYAVCGSSNLAFDIFLYFIFYNFTFAKENVDLVIVTLSPHIAALFSVYPITLFTGFLLNKYISFLGSSLKTETQFFRYWLVSLGAIVINYVLLKFFVEYLAFYPTPSRLLTIVITVAYSYILQRKYSFKPILTK